MHHIPKHHRWGHYFDLPPRWGWVAWVMLIISVVSLIVTVALWPNPVALLVEMGVVVATLLALAMVIYEFDWLVFKTTQPRREDLTAPPTDDDHLPTKKE